MEEYTSPTRMNLLVKQAQVRLALQGVDLLARKKDAMLQEFFNMVGELYQLRVSLQKSMQNEVGVLIIREAIHGSRSLISAAGVTKQDLNIEIIKKNFWGVNVLDIKSSFQVRDSFTRGYSPRGIESGIDNTAGGFEQVVELIFNIIPEEIKLQRVGEEIRKINRRINALKQQLIPALQGQVTYIFRALEERARDATFKLKRFKKKRRNQK